MTQRRVLYTYDPEVPFIDFSHFVPQHAMKPWRLFAIHELVERCGLVDYMYVATPPRISLRELERYHTHHFLLELCQHNTRSWQWQPDLSDVSYSGDCPPVEGVVEFSCAAVAASLMGAVLINARKIDVAINWAGGLHHAHMAERSGFCYVNDVVIAITELLKKHQRVLYVDIDIHHGDGVEEAFYTTDRVFTLSFHKYGDGFFPGTGHTSDVGVGRGRYCSMNVPLFDGVGDFAFVDLFKFTVGSVFESYGPEVVVMQCGGDSLSLDRVGTFNLSSIAHGECVSFVSQLGVPVLALGGGGYNIRSVVKLWTYETSILCGHPLSPYHLINASGLASAWLYEPGSTLHIPSELEFTAPHHTAAAQLQMLRSTIAQNVTKIPPPNIARQIQTPTAGQNADGTIPSEPEEDESNEGAASEELGTGEKGPATAVPSS